METGLVVALIAATVSLVISLINLSNQKSLEKLKSGLNFEDRRLERLHDLKQSLMELAEMSNYAASLLLKHHNSDLSKNELIKDLIDYQYKQEKLVIEIQKLYRRNGHFFDKDIRKALDLLVRGLENRAQSTLSKDIDEQNITKLLEERVTYLEGFIPDFESRMNAQLYRIVEKLSDS